MSENIIDKNLAKIIKTKIYVDEINSIEEIEDICIQDINLMETKLNIDLTDIVKMINLKSISLKFFEITDKVIDAINKLKFIEEIEFSMCTFNTKKTLTRKLKTLAIYNCTNFDINILDENEYLQELQIIHSGIVNIVELNTFKNLRYLKLSDCNIISLPKICQLEKLEKLYLNNTALQYDIDIRKIGNLKFISLNGSTVQSKEEYIKKLYDQNNKLMIEFKENNLPIE